ncbi:MAG: ADP-ribosylglycohydrolase family protein [Microbacteriaceae bacterium]
MSTEDDITDERMDMLETLAGAGLAAPPTGDADLLDVETYGRWSWGTRHLDEGDLYVFEFATVIQELLDGGPFFALAHAGHGMNSYGLNLVTTKGPIAAFVQHGWGGVYTDPLQAGFRIGQTYARLHALFDRIADPEAKLRWVLLYSEFRGMCGIVDLLRYRRRDNFEDAFIDLRDHESFGRSDEVPLFEFFLDEPHLLTEPFNREYDWAFPPAPHEVTREPGKPIPFRQLSTEERLDQVARAQSIAAIAHRGQVDKLGVDYIHHPAAVSARFDPEQETLECCAAWLHDVIEDTGITADELVKAGIHSEVVAVVQLLTRHDAQGDEYYEAIAASPAARAVKLSDLAHNTHPARAAQLPDDERAKLRVKYEHAYELLGATWPTDEDRAAAPRYEFGNFALYRHDELKIEESETVSSNGGEVITFAPRGRDADHDNDVSISLETERRAWRYAAAYTLTWPDLFMSWFDWYEGIAPHFVLHQDVLGGGALHFDSDEHPFWVSPSGDERQIDWDDVHEQGVHVAEAGFDPYGAWGYVESLEGLATRALAYDLIHAVLAQDREEGSLVVRPAKLLAPEGEATAYDLRDEFPTLESSIDWYTELISVEFRRRNREGNAAYWHEPLWLISDHGTPLLIVDEGGRAHIRGEEYDITDLFFDKGAASAAAAFLVEAARAKLPTVDEILAMIAAMDDDDDVAPRQPVPTRNAKVTEDGHLALAGWVTELEPGEIFVFGSNAGGAHGGGAARIAHQQFGAVWGEGHGLHGQTYAIDTMTDRATMAAEIQTFIDFAIEHGDLTFLVTEIGCGIGPYQPEDVAPYFTYIPLNVALPESFLDVIRRLTPDAPEAGAESELPVTTGVGPLALRPERTLGPVIGRKSHERQAPTKLSAQQLDRAVGSVIGMAVGDALGSQYEFGSAHPDSFVPEFGIGKFGHGIGEWTDDTAMAIPILEALANGESLRDMDVLAERVLGSWLEWAATAKDVGAQTSAVLSRLNVTSTEGDARAAAKAVHDASGRSAGNGSLMRIGPLALGYLAEGREGRLVEAAARVTQLTHWESSNIEATALWSLFIRQAILTGDFDPWEQRLHIVDPARGLDGAELIDMGLHGHPRDYRQGNGWVVKAFQAAHVAVRGASSFREAIFRAIQGGGDTDTVAAITGALAGAKWGVSQIPLSWQRRVHGWPGYNANDLARLAILAARRGATDSLGWPAGETVLNLNFRKTDPVQHPFDSGVWLGSQSSLSKLPQSVSAVVSLGRLGTAEVPDGVESIRVWLIDTPGENLNLEWTLADAADMIAELRAEGRHVFVHCAEARSRTSAVAALYAARHRGISLDEAWNALDGRHGTGVLPYYDPATFLREAVARIIEAEGEQ